MFHLRKVRSPTAEICNVLMPNDAVHCTTLGGVYITFVLGEEEGRINYELSRKEHF